MGVFLLLGLVRPVCVPAQQVIRHALHVVLQPDLHALQVTDTVTFQETLPPSHAEPWYFTGVSHFLHMTFLTGLCGS